MVTKGIQQDDIRKLNSSNEIQTGEFVVKVHSWGRCTVAESSQTKVIVLVCSWELAAIHGGNSLIIQRTNAEGIVDPGITICFISKFKENCINPKNQVPPSPSSRVRCQRLVQVGQGRDEGAEPPIWWLKTSSKSTGTNRKKVESCKDVRLFLRYKMFEESKENESEAGI